MLRQLFVGGTQVQRQVAQRNSQQGHRHLSGEPVCIESEPKKDEDEED
jgi:hypothetical protein